MMMDVDVFTYFLIPSSSFNFGLICSSIIKLMSTPHAVKTVSLSPASNKAIMISSTKTIRKITYDEQTKEITTVS